MFSQLLTELAAQIAAERDLIDIDYSWDPAYSGWLREVEECEARISKLLSQVQGLELRRPEDRPLQRMCLVIDELMGSGEREEFDRLHRMLGWCQELFSCPGTGTGAVARRLTRMLQIGIERIDAMAEMRDAGDDGGNSGSDRSVDALLHIATL